MLGQVRPDEVTFNLIFTKLQLHIIILLGCSHLQPGVQMSLEKYHVMGEQIFCQYQHSDEELLKLITQRSRKKQHKTAPAMWTNLKMDYCLFITLTPKPIFCMLIFTRQVSISIQFLTVKMRLRAMLLLLAFAFPTENAALSVGLFFLIHVHFSTPFSIWSTAVPWATNKLARP